MYIYIYRYTIDIPFWLQTPASQGEASCRLGSKHFIFLSAHGSLLRRWLTLRVALVQLWFRYGALSRWCLRYYAFGSPGVAANSPTVRTCPSWSTTSATQFVCMNYYLRMKATSWRKPVPRARLQKFRSVYIQLCLGIRITSTLRPARWMPCKL